MLQKLKEERYFGVLHNVNDAEPAVIYNNGDTQFYKYGIKHNPNYPSITVNNDLINRITVNGSCIIEKKFDFGFITEIRNYATFKKYKVGQPMEVKIHNDDETISIFHRFGFKHKENAPAEIRNYHGRFSGMKKIWYKFDILHRDDGPAVITKNLNTETGTVEKFIKFGNPHRSHLIGPALIDTDMETSNKNVISYLEFNLCHNTIGPADITFFNKFNNMYKLIEIDGPKLKILDKDKLAYIADYRQFGILHREDGPAIVLNETTDTNFFIPEKRFFLFGQSIEESVYKKLGAERLIAENSSIIEKTVRYGIHHLDIFLNLEFGCSFKNVFGRIHCSDGPAVIGESISDIDGSHYKFTLKVWRQFGRMHREDGPAFLLQDEFGRVIREEYFQFGQRHRDSGPAIVENYFDEKLDVTEEFKMKQASFYQFDYLHNDDGPAIIEFDKNGCKIKEDYYQFNKYHREDGPAIIEYFSDGRVSKEYYYQFGYLHSQSKYGWGPSVKIFKKTETDEYHLVKIEYHCLDMIHNEYGPARVYYNPDGSIRKQIWFKYGHKHRLDGPAWVKRNTDGRIILKKYFIMNNLHRLDGPAIIESSGYYQEWCLFGQRIFKSAGCCIGGPRMDQEIIDEIRKYFGAIGRDIPPELQKEIKKKEREFQFQRTQEQNILINLSQDDKGETL